jgi:hypothetical protein
LLLPSSLALAFSLPSALSLLGSFLFTRSALLSPGVDRLARIRARSQSTAVVRVSCAVVCVSLHSISPCSALLSPGVDWPALVRARSRSTAILPLARPLVRALLVVCSH